MESICSGVNLTTVAKTLANVSGSLPSIYWYKIFFRYAGDTLTFVDFVMYELVDQHKCLVPSCLKKYPNLEAFQTRFEELPKIAEYMKSSAFMKAPMNNKMAKFGF